MVFQNKKTEKFSSDVFMKNLFTHLLRDFRSVYGSNYHAGLEQKLANVSDFRKVVWPSRTNVKASLFKRDYQLESLFKRYRFTDDLYTGEELQEMTDKKFLDTQLRIGNQPFVRTQILHCVIQRARQICSDILGKFDGDNLYDACRFGKRASVGCQAKFSYLDTKVFEKPLTGSLDHITWMKSVYLEEDPILLRLLTKRVDSDTMWVECESLKSVNVAKSYKSLRKIMPNTLIGGFYSFGLGRLIQQRLELYGLDIRHLQKKHRRLAKKSSKNRKNATTDLVSASDSFFADVVNMLLPRDWYVACKKGRLSVVEMNDTKYMMSSFMTMGIGFTFPLQTLLFYVLLQSIKELLHLKGDISVFGDDLIYPTKMHDVVCHVFNGLRFQINEDKTFVHDYFRESCGGDYYRGIDVRPFQPEGEYKQLSRTPYLSLIYKTYNGLLERWDRSEITQTLYWLEREILRVTDAIFQVPKDFPAYSGIRVDQPLNVWYNGYAPICYTDRGSKNPYMWKFRHLQQCADKRIVVNLETYYWDTLREPLGLDEVFDESYWEVRWDRKILRSKNQYIKPLEWKSDPYDAPRETLTWEKVRNYTKNYRSKLTGQRLIRKRATVALKGPSRFVYSKGLTSCWTNGVSS